MKILFLYTSEIIFDKGGVQRVTKTLSNFFEKRELKTYFLSQNGISNNELNHFFLPEKKKLNSKKNFKYISSLVINLKIDIIVNQAALGGGMSRLCYEAKKKSNVKVISVIHNSMLGNVEGFTFSNKKLFKIIPVSWLPFTNSILIKKILLRLYILKYENKYKKLYEISDRIVILSENYFYQFKFFVKHATKEKVINIYNPCTFDLNANDFKKENELLFVGRINITQKRVDILLNIWKELFEKYPNWKLNIVGDGPDLNYLKKIADKMNLDRIFFVGHQNPEHYYKRAKIFCMTSSFEGLPLAIIEAQNYFVFPILFNSFPSAVDLVKTNITGILIKPFDIKEYILKLEDLILKYEEKYEVFSNEAKKNVSMFSINIIGNQWLKLFDQLLNEQ